MYTRRRGGGGGGAGAVAAAACMMMGPGMTILLFLKRKADTILEAFEQENVVMTED